MIINGESLLSRRPLTPMEDTKQRLFGISHGLSEAGYDIRIKQDVFFQPVDYSIFDDPDLLAGWMLSGCKPRVFIDGEPQGFGNMVLASTIERFDVDSNLVGRVTDKSSHARRGLSVYNTVIEPGWAGYLTLELVYHEFQKELHIPAGTGIAQVLFHTLANDAQYGEGKYQNQGASPQEAILES